MVINLELYLNELHHKYFVSYVLKFEEQLFQENLYNDVFVRFDMSSSVERTCVKIIYLQGPREDLKLKVR